MRRPSKGRGCNSERAALLPPSPRFVNWLPLHWSHRASLLRKDPAHYGHVFAAAAAGGADAAGLMPAAAAAVAAAAAEPAVPVPEVDEAFLPRAYRALGYVWPASVPPELRGVAPHDGLAAAICAPIQAPPRTGKGGAKRRAAAGTAGAVEDAAVPGTEAQEATPRATRARRRSAAAVAADVATPSPRRTRRAAGSP